MSRDDQITLFCMNCGSRGTFSAIKTIEQVICMQSNFKEQVVQTEEVVKYDHYLCASCNSEKVSFERIGGEEGSE